MQIPHRRLATRLQNAGFEQSTADFMTRALASSLAHAAAFPFACRLSADSLSSDGSAASLAATAASFLLSSAQIAMQQSSAPVAGELQNFCSLGCAWTVLPSECT